MTPRRGSSPDPTTAEGSSVAGGPPDAAADGSPVGDPSRSRDRGLLAHLARFCGALRSSDVDVTVKDEIDAAKALGLVDLSDRREVRLALRMALKVQRDDWGEFGRLFDEHWRSPGASRRRDGRAGEDGAAGESRDPGARSGDERDPGPGGQEERSDSGGAVDREDAGVEREPLAVERIRVPGPEGSLGSEVHGGPEEGEPGYSARPLLRRKPFEECSADELQAMERLLARLARRLAVRRSRKRVPAGGGRRGEVDLRRSLRGLVRTGGEPLNLARRRRALEEPSLVLLCDTSGSMDPYSRFLMTFILSLRRVARNAELFVFNTELHRLTGCFVPGRIEASLQRIASEVPDWSGGTRIGECLGEFVDHHMQETVSSRTTVVILSDGLDRGATELLADAMAAIQRRARRIVWLNPLLGDPRYRPAARGMQAALPYVDHFVPGHNLESLEGLLPLLER